MKRTLILAACLTLSACATQIVSQNDRSITIEHFYHGGYPQAQAMADEFCKQHGNRLAVAQGDPYGYATTFACIGK